MAGKTSARPMTGGMAIVETLIANKVDRVFGLPGAQLYALFDALAQRSDVMRLVLGEGHPALSLEDERPVAPPARLRKQRQRR